MTLTVAQGCETFLSRLVPLESQRAAAARHRARVEASLRGALDGYLFRETGSFRHGTGVRGHCDVDLLVGIRGPRPGSSDTALAWVKNALAASFPVHPGTHQPPGRCHRIRWRRRNLGSHPGVRDRPRR